MSTQSYVENPHRLTQPTQNFHSPVYPTYQQNQVNGQQLHSQQYQNPSHFNLPQQIQVHYQSTTPTNQNSQGSSQRPKTNQNLLD